MSENNRFKKNLKVDTKVNQYSPDFNDIESREHSLWIQEEVNNNRQQLLHRLELTMQEIFHFFKNNSKQKDAQFYGFGRIKSEHSMGKNIIGTKNLLDVIGATFVVDSAASKTSPVDSLRDAIDVIRYAPMSPAISTLTSELERVLQVTIEAGEHKTLQDKDASFHIDMFGHKQEFKNIELLYVHGINQYIARVKKFHVSDFPDRAEIFELLRQSKSTTNYGASIDMFNSFVGYAKSGPSYSIVQRFKPVVKANGYAAYHLGAHDSLTRLPIEFKFMTVENLYIAEDGAASHQNIDGKSRNFLDHFELQSNSPKKQISELISFFANEDRIQRILSPIPNFVMLNHAGGTRINNNWENFAEYYERQLKAMPEKERALYYIGLQLVPELRGHLPADFCNSSNKNKYPHNLLPIIDKINRLEIAQK